MGALWPCTLWPCPWGSRPGGCCCQTLRGQSRWPTICICTCTHVIVLLHCLLQDKVAKPTTVVTGLHGGQPVSQVRYSASLGQCITAGWDSRLNLVSPILDYVILCIIYITCITYITSTSWGGNHIIYHIISDHIMSYEGVAGQETGCDGAAGTQEVCALL